jgi:hypothetical protein
LESLLLIIGQCVRPGPATRLEPVNFSLCQSFVCEAFFCWVCFVSGVVLCVSFVCVCGVSVLSVSGCV